MPGRDKYTVCKVCRLFIVSGTTSVDGVPVGDTAQVPTPNKPLSEAEKLRVVLPASNGEPQVFTVAARLALALLTLSYKVY
jgi:hypothetical protein